MRSLVIGLFLLDSLRFCLPHSSQSALNPLAFSGTLHLLTSVLWHGWPWIPFGLKDSGLELLQASAQATSTQKPPSFLLPVSANFSCQYCIPTLPITLTSVHTVRGFGSTTSQGLILFVYGTG